MLANTLAKELFQEEKLEGRKVGAPVSYTHLPLEYPEFPESREKIKKLSQQQRQQLAGYIGHSAKWEQMTRKEFELIRSGRGQEELSMDHWSSCLLYTSRCV